MHKLFSIFLLGFSVAALWSRSGSASGSDQQFQKTSSVPYAKYAKDNIELTCDIYVPQEEGTHPTILMIHGGAWRSGSKSHMVWHAQAAAKKGFVVIAINYRHAPKHKWPAQIVDCRNAMDWLLNNSRKYKIDKKRIAVWGYSAGGQLAALLATEVPKGQNRYPIRCAICGGTPVDLTLFPKGLLTYWLADSLDKAPKKYKQASPTNHLSKDDPPFFFYHGQNDFIAPIKGVKTMVAKA
ncbi:MAG: alpha/beta hydrolase, partial [Planctomycetota bacterium]|nr:alpha/beta hydrolase [Planctomycetota bacterium]